MDIHDMDIHDIVISTEAAHAFVSSAAEKSASLPQLLIRHNALAVVLPFSLLKLSAGHQHYENATPPILEACPALSPALANCSFVPNDFSLAALTRPCVPFAR
jgi:hypothetical protein